MGIGDFILYRNTERNFEVWNSYMLLNKKKTPAGYSKDRLLVEMVTTM